MKKRLLKTILVAAMLGMGTSAWATEPVTTGFVTVYSNDFESGSSPWGWSTGSAAVNLIEETGGNHYMSLTRYDSGKNNYYNRSLLFSATYTKYELTFKWFAKISDKVQIKFSTSHTSFTVGYQFRYNNPTANKLCLTNSAGNSSEQEITNYTKSTEAPTSVTDDFYTVKVASDGTNVRFTFTNPEGTSVTKDYTINDGNRDDFKLGGFQLQSQTTSDYHYIDDIVLKVPSHTYTVNAVDDSDNILSELATGDAGESAQYSATGLPKVVVKDGKYYVLNDGTVSNFATQNYTMGTEDETKSITYTEDASIVYFSELETLSSTGEKTGNYSGGKGAAVKSGGISSIITLPAGNYVATGAFCNDEKNRGMYLRTSNTKTDDNIIVYTGGTYWTGEHSTDEFNLNASTAIYLTGFTGTGSSVNQSATLDYIIIRKTGEIATIGTNCYTTFSSAYPLALGSMTASTGEVTAYYAKAVGDGKVTMKSIEENVEAGEGLILRGTPNATITIPVAASGDAITNYLVGCPTATELTTPNENYYVLVNNGVNVEFQPLSGTYTNNKVTIPAGKAYLNYAGAGARLSIVFDDETTGVQELKNSRIEGLKTGNYYNLSGQRVAQPAKGLYIVNGKKVLVK